MKVKITIAAPGADGVVAMIVNNEELRVLKNFAYAWNERNPLHAQPFVTIEIVTPCDGNHGAPRCSDPECWHQ
jgi:hypothetical protein